MLKYTIWTIISLCCTTLLRSQTFEFTENKGQWNDSVQFRGSLSTGAFFLTASGYRVLQFHPDDFEAALGKATGHSNHAHSPAKLSASIAGSSNVEVPTHDDIPVRAHAYDVVFEGANTKAQIIRERPLAGYSNYFIGNDSTRWASDVQSFGTVVYRNIYPGIDLKYFSENGFLKYDLIVHPNGRVEDIVMRYDGINGLKLKSGELMVSTSVTEIKERSPYSYQLDNGSRREVGCRYQVTGNRVTFKTSGYQRNAVLVIDPTLVFSTFAGSNSDNWGYTATYDGAGNAYGGGIVFGTGWPVTTGAFQTSFGGGGNTGDPAGFDIGIIKLNPNGSQRIYATYIGGSGNEQPHSLVADGAGNLVMAGRTTSANYPLLPGNNLIGTGGGWDIVITKLNASGTAMLGSVKIGGTADDGTNIRHKNAGGSQGPQSLQQNYGDDARSEVLLDGAGNVYVASCTRSTNFPVTANAAQSALRGQQDALLLKFSPNLGTLLYSSLIGGGGDDAAYVLIIEDDGNILIAGGTGSTDFPGDKSGTVGTANSGGVADGFIVRFSQAGALLKSVYIGTNGTDQVYGIQKDRFGFIYIMGTSTGAFGVRNAPFSQPGGKQFIAKLEPNFSAYVYSTVFGPATPFPNISPTAFLVDICENVYVSGWGGSFGSNSTFPNSGTNGLTVTPDALKSQTDGKDFYFFVLEKNAISQLYGSFFGQQDPLTTGTPDHVDGGTSRFDADGVIYQGLCANCSPGQFPTTPGVVAPLKPGTATCNLAVIKISFDLSGVRSGVKSAIGGVDGDSSACVPATVDFRDTVALARSYEWNFGDGSPTATTTTPNISHVYNQTGTYLVRLIAIDTTRCFPRDTSFVNIIVREDQVPVLAAATKLQPCESNAYRFDNLSVPYPSKPFQSNSFTWVFGDNSPNVVAGAGSVTHQYPGAGTYNVLLVLSDTNYCNAPDTFRLQLRVSPNVVAAFETPAAGCTPYLAAFNNTSAGGTSFLWDFGNGVTSTDINPSVLYTTPGLYVVKLIAFDTTSCNFVDSTTFNITVSDGPAAGFNYAPNPPEENIITTFTNVSEPASFYIWRFGDGDTLLTTRRDTIVRHQYPATGTFTACIVAVNQFGCRDTVCQQIDVVVNPLLDVVTAFTPNEDGVNDKAVVFGYGVSKMTFRIFNRWGQIVFESADPGIGWDGKFKGQPQPMDAYGYTLDAELIDGQKVKKSGSITLIR